MTREPLVSLDRIVETAAERARTSVDLDTEWGCALQLLVESVNEESNLAERGGATLTAKLTDLLTERLFAETAFSLDAAIRQRPLPVRFVVAGFARSGTTFLHRLLACDPDVEFLPTWQAFRTVPAPGGPDVRRQEVAAFIDGLRTSNPESFKIHPLEVDAPEEEVFLLQLSFASMLFALQSPVPSYLQRLNTSTHTAAYEFMLDVLRLNEHVAGVPTGRPRVMKSPQFVLDLAVVTDVMPDAVVIQNHRDPVDLVGSYCSTYGNSRRMHCTSVDLHALGRERLGALSQISARSLAVREAADAAGTADRFVDVQYAHLIADPIAVVEAVYRAAGLELNGTTRRAAEAWVADHPQHAGGSHQYDLSDYGLDRAKVEAELSAYIERFQPGVEP